MTNPEAIMIIASLVIVVSAVLAVTGLLFISKRKADRDLDRLSELIGGALESARRRRRQADKANLT